MNGEVVVVVVVVFVVVQDDIKYLYHHDSITVRLSKFKLKFN